jgi:hypothetical protein
MKTRLVVTALAIAAAVLVFNAPAYAQNRWEFNIPFSFIAHGKALPAGDYYLYTDDPQEVMTIESKAAKGNAAVMAVETRTYERKPTGAPELVFDKIGDKSYVSELLPEGADGYVLLVTKEKHTHHSLKGSRAKK